jgi:hypothetical protein
MKLITIKLIGEGILKRAWLKEGNQAWSQAVQLQFDQQGTANADIKEDIEYSLSWALLGTPGDAWTLEVEDPAVYQWKYFSTSTWFSTKISLNKTLKNTGYTDLRLIKTK